MCCLASKLKLVDLFCLSDTFILSKTGNTEKERRTEFQGAAVTDLSVNCESSLLFCQQKLKLWVVQSPD